MTYNETLILHLKSAIEKLAVKYSQKENVYIALKDKVEIEVEDVKKTVRHVIVTVGVTRAEIFTELWRDINNSNYNKDVCGMLLILTSEYKSQNSVDQTYYWWDILSKVVVSIYEEKLTEIPTDVNSFNFEVEKVPKWFYDDYFGIPFVNLTSITSSKLKEIDLTFFEDSINLEGIYLPKAYIQNCFSHLKRFDKLKILRCGLFNMSSEFPESLEEFQCSEKLAYATINCYHVEKLFNLKTVILNNVTRLPEKFKFPSNLEYLEMTSLKEPPLLDYLHNLKRTKFTTIEK